MILRLNDERVVDIIGEISVPGIPLSVLELGLVALSMAEQGNQRFDAICQAICSFPDTNCLEDVNL